MVLHQPQIVLITIFTAKMFAVFSTNDCVNDNNAFKN